MSFADETPSIDGLFKEIEDLKKAKKLLQDLCFDYLMFSESVVYHDTYRKKHMVVVPEETIEEIKEYFFGESH